MRRKPSPNHRKKDSFLSEKSLIFAVRIANATLNTHLNSQFAETLVFILEYAQLMSQAILLYPSLYSEKDNYYGSFPIIRGAIYAAKLVNPSYFLDFEEERDFTAKTLRIIFALIIIKYSLGIYFFHKVFKGKNLNKTVIQIFRFFHHTQSRIFYYWTSCFFFRSIIAKDFTFLGSGRTGNFIVCLMVILLEFALGITSKLRLYYVLPTKSLLAARDNHVETLTFLQKFIIQLFQACLSETAIATRWILALTNFVLTVWRTFLYFSGLPLYSIKGLLLQGSLVGLVMMLHFSGLMHLILVSTEIVNESLKFLLLSWIFLGFISIQLSQNLIKTRIFKLLTQNDFSCELLVQRMTFINQCLKRLRFSSKLTEKTDWFYLLIESIRQNRDAIFDMTRDMDLCDKSEKATFFGVYLEKLFVQHPESEFIKLHLAFYYAKKARNYARAIALIIEMQKEIGSRLYLNASVLLSEIQAALRSNYKAGKSLLDLETFAQSQKCMEKLKEKIKKQVGLQYEVCEELLHPHPDLNKIYEDSQSAYDVKQEVFARMRKMLNIIPEYHVSPLGLCAYYNLIINQSPIEYQKLCEVYHLRSQKYRRFYKKETLREENLYESNCALFLLSGLRAEVAKVVHCNSSVKTVCGGDPRWYIGSKVYNKICSPSLRLAGERFYRSLAETEALVLYDKAIPSYIFNKEGFLFDAEFYLNTYPSVTHGYLLALIIRPKLESRDFIIVRENGQIEGASQDICKRFGIFQPESGRKKFHINQICNELERVNDAMNRADKHSEAEDAEYLCSLYKETGNEVCLTPIDQQDASSYIYFCKVSNLISDPLVLRVFNLQEVEADEKSQPIEDIVVVKQKSIESLKTMGLEEWNIDGEEKEQGWIDFNVLDSKRKNERRKKSKLQTNTTQGGKSVHTQRFEKTIEHQETTERKALVIVKRVESITNSTSSKKSNSKGVFEAVKLALETKRNSKYFLRSALFLFTLLILIIFIVVGLEVNLNNTIQSLGIKKDIMDHAQLRGYDIINIQTVTRGIYDHMNGRISLQEYGRVGVSLERFIDIAVAFFQELDTVNKKLLNSTNFLTGEDSKRLFYVQNVEMLDAGSTQLMNSFQAVDTLIQAGLQMIRLARLNQSISRDLFRLLNINLMNDVLVKNTEIAVMTVSSVQKEVDSMQYLNEQYYIYVSTATFVSLCYLCSIIWLQYKGQKNNLIGVTKLSRFGIESVLEQYGNFRVNLLEREQIPANFLGREEMFSTALPGVYGRAKESYFSSPNSSKLQRRFLFFVMKAAILPLVLAFALLISTIFTPGSIDYLNNKLNQMSFINQIAIECSFSTSGTIELPIGNGTSRFWNNPIIPAMNLLMGQFSEDRKKLFTSFLDQDLLKNKEISQLLFGDGCQLIDPSVHFYCEILKSSGVRTSLAQMLGEFETLLIERMRDFENSDRSTAALRRNRLLNYETLFSLKRIISGSSLLISQFLKKEFENKLEELKVRKIIGVCCGLGSLFVIFALLWELVMKPIRESDNNFKKVLQIFPARLILSNFPLKIFLLKTSSIDLHVKDWN